MFAAAVDFVDSAGVVDVDFVDAAAVAVVEQLVEWQLGQVERPRVKLLLLVP